MKQTTFQLLFGFVAGLAIGYFFFHNCNKSKPCPEVQVQQTKTSDTVKQDLPDDSSGWHQPTMASEFVPGSNIARSLRTDSDFKSQFDQTRVPTIKADDYFNFSGDVADIVSDHFVERTYSDTNHLKEGDVIVQNTISENKLRKQRVLLQNFKQTVITNTITNTVTEKEKRKARLYWNLTAIGDEYVNVNAAGGGLTLQFKDTRQLQVNYLYQFRKLFPAQSNNQFQLTLINPFSKH